MMNTELNLNVITRKELRTSVTKKQTIKFNVLVVDTNSNTVFNEFGDNVLYTPVVTVDNGVDLNDELKSLARSTVKSLSDEDIPFTISRFMVEGEPTDGYNNREVTVFVRIHAIDTLMMRPIFKLELTKLKDVFPVVETEHRLIDLLVGDI